MEYKYLDGIKQPSDIKQLNKTETAELCAEIRDCILNTVAENGGHLASNLGAVELTVAIHKVFDAPTDSIIFDVGHQSYTHKLLTGRFESFGTLRKNNGISGFMRPDESIFDPVISGHSSTSVSSAYGIAKGKELRGDPGYSIAVIGDGALTGGMVYEAFNNVERSNDRLIVILNDNKLSISKNRGSIAKHLGKIRTRKNYFKFKNGVERFLVKIPFIGKKLRSFVIKIKLMLKNAIYDSNIFESLGFYYMGPVDGHDVETMTDMLEIAKKRNQPVLIHVKTVKGKGYKPSEEMPGLYHGVSHFDISTGVKPSSTTSFSEVFGDELCRIAEQDKTVCAVTAAMADGTGLVPFSKEFPDRFFDVGIAEQHAVTFSAALISSGMKAVFAVYSTFLQRGIDQVLHDAAISSLPLTLAVDRAGFVGDDGETHQGLYDVALLSAIPGVSIFAPSDYNELRTMLRIRLSDPKGVAAIRYPRGKAPEGLNLPEYKGEDYTVIGSGKIALVTYGTLVAEVLDAVKQLKEKGIDAAVVKLNRISPLSRELTDTLCSFERVLFFEEASLSGGAAEHVGLNLMTAGFKGDYKLFAAEGFVKQAKVTEQRKMFGLDTESIVKICMNGESI